MRMVSVMSVLLALLASCSNQNKKTDPTVEHKDASKVESTDGPLAAPVTDEQLTKLFHTVAGCGRPCPEEAELGALARSSPAQVAAVALQIMADPKSKTDQGVGQMSMIFVEDWLKTGPDEAARHRTSKALERVAAEGSTFMRTKAYELLGHFLLPDARQILIAEVENPARDASERDYAGGSLGLLLEDFELIRSWLRDDQPYHWQAALEMMKTFEDFNDANQPLWTEGRALLVALAKRRELPAPVVYDLAFYFEIYLDADPSDAEIRKLSERWAKHPDDMAAGQMKKILAAH
jgi:hypothetical protein